MPLAEEPPSDRGPVPGSNETLRVLLVEDNADYSDLIRTTLNNHGFEVTHSQYLDAAIERLEQNHFDALVLDLGLPDGSGIFTLVSACRFSEDLPIIVLTGNSDRSLAMAASEGGVQEYVIKDRVERKSMPGLIRRAIERHHRRQSLNPVNLPERQRIHDAVRDQTTGLANDILFEDRLRQSLTRAQHQQRNFALMVIQLDGFNAACECCSAEPCDRVLRLVADALGRLFGAEDTVARMGVDTFGIILGEVGSQSDIYQAAGPVMTALADLELPDGVHPSLTQLTARLGAALFPDQGRRPEELLSCALGQPLASAILGAGEYQFTPPSRMG
ncbi:MAG: diguanylate cyclase [Myxococcales bacterium]|nr:diguanylate cyclase [Myxococcales bacterium]